VKEGDIIEAFFDRPLHLINRCHAPCHTETELRRPPILFDKIKFAVIFWIKITEMPARLDQLLKLRLLRDEVGLQKKDTPATAVSAIRRATKTQALGGKGPSLRPQATLPDDDLHAFEPAGHGGVVFREIKGLRLAV
jgi:hypothetical protein